MQLFASYFGTKSCCLRLCAEKSMTAFSKTCWRSMWHSPNVSCLRQENMLTNFDHRTALLALLPAFLGLTPALRVLMYHLPRKPMPNMIGGHAWDCRLADSSSVSWTSILFSIHLAASQNLAVASTLWQVLWLIFAIAEAMHSIALRISVQPQMAKPNLIKFQINRYSYRSALTMAIRVWTSLPSSFFLSFFLGAMGPTIAKVRPLEAADAESGACLTWWVITELTALKKLTALN